MKKAVFLLSIVLSALSASTTTADTIYVNADGSGDYPTIQAAIDAATDGDEVVLRAGVYTGNGNRDIDFKAKAITVRSLDPDDDDCMRQTIIDPEGIGVIVRFINDEGPDSIFEGFTLGAGDVSEDIQRGMPGFFEFSKDARPTTRRLRNKPTNSSWTPTFLESAVLKSTFFCPGIDNPPEGRIWDGHNPFHQPVDTTNYHGSGDLNLDGIVSPADKLMLTDIINGTEPENIRADLNGDGLISPADSLLLADALNGTDVLPAWWNELTTPAQRNDWIDKFIAVDKTDEHIYTPSFFVCHHFAYQTYIRSAFERDDFAVESTEFDGGQTVYNVPLYRVGVTSPHHAITAILVGDNPLNFDDWRFIEPQTDYDVIPGGWNMLYGAMVNVGNPYNTQDYLVNFLVEATGWTLENYSPDFILTRPDTPVAAVDNRKDYWNPVIVPHADTGLLFFEKMREDMSRTTDIHMADVSDLNYEQAVSVANRYHFSRLLDTTKDPDGAIHMLFESKSGEDLQNLFHGIYDPNNQILTDVSQIAEGLRLPAMGRIEVTADNEIFVFWFENSGYSGMYEKGIHWTKSTELGWQTPELLNGDLKSQQSGNWLNRQFDWYTFDTQIMDDGRLLLVYIEFDNPNLDLYLSQFIYDGSWTGMQIENTGWNYGAQGVRLCKSTDGTIHLGYWRAREPSVCYSELDVGRREGRGDLWHRTFNGVSWSEPVVVDDTDGVCCLSIASGEDGDVYMTWERRIDPNNVVPVYAKYKDGAWRNSQLPTVRPGADAWYPKVSQLADGTVVVYWSSRCSELVTIEMEVVEPTPPHAESETVETRLGVPLTISLNASDDGLPEPPATLSYILTSLPSHGSLNDPQAGIINAVPYTLANNGNQVVYTPNEYFLGSDEFDFKANDSGAPPYGGDSNIAVITIDVLECSDVTIGTGASTWSYPMFALYDDSRTQVIYLADEIGAAGIITALALDVATLPGQTMNNWTIRMKHTPLSSYSVASLDADDWAIVYQADETVDSTGCCTFTFSTPFEYNGTDNLMIDFCFDNDSYTFPGYCRSSTTGSTRSAYAYIDSHYDDPLGWSGTSSPTVHGSNNVPNVRLTVCGLSGTMSTELSLDNLWMYQNVLTLTKSNLTAAVLITNDPLENTGYTYDWEFILPDDVTIAPAITAGGGFSDPCCTFAAPSCDELGGLSDSGQALTVRVTVTGDDYDNTGIAEAQFGIAILGDVNNDKIVNLIDRIIMNVYWRTGSAGDFTFRDCDIDCNGFVNLIDRIIANEIWRGNLGSGSVSDPCPLR